MIHYFSFMSSISHTCSFPQSPHPRIPWEPQALWAAAPIAAGGVPSGPPDHPGVSCDSQARAAPGSAEVTRTCPCTASGILCSFVFLVSCTSLTLPGSPSRSPESVPEQLQHRQANTGSSEDLCCGTEPTTGQSE